MRQDFVALKHQREAWFQNAQGNLRVCLYDPQLERSCSTGEQTVANFTRSGNNWVPAQVVKVICM